MQIIIKTKNLELSESLNTFIAKRMGGLRKFLGVFQGHHLPVASERDLFDTFVEIEKETKHHRKGDVFKAEAKIYLPGKSLFAKAHGEDLIKLVNEVKDELESEIRKYRTRIIDIPRRKIQKSRG